MTKIAFAGSNSSTSINHQLVAYAASLAGDCKVIKLTDYDVPMYDIDIEEKGGIPQGIQDIKKEIMAADHILISVNEHNGNVSAFWKNILDWLSRMDRNIFDGRKVSLMSTSPGKGGASSALGLMENSLPRFGAELKGSLSVPSFYDNFKDGELVDEELNKKLISIL